MQNSFKILILLYITAEKPKYPIEQVTSLAKKYNPLPVPAEEDKKQALKAFADKVEVDIQCCNERVLEKTEAPQLGTEISFEKSVHYPIHCSGYLCSSTQIKEMLV